MEKNRTVKAVLEDILVCQGKIIQGDGDAAFNEAVEAIRTMLLRTVIERTSDGANIESSKEEYRLS
jgi:hypothetical protein